MKTRPVINQRLASRTSGEADLRATRAAVRTACGAMHSATSSRHVFGVHVACGRGLRCASLVPPDRHWLRRARHTVFAPRLNLHVDLHAAATALLHETATHRLQQTLVREAVTAPPPAVAPPTSETRLTLVERVIERTQRLLAPGVRVERATVLEHSTSALHPAATRPTVPAAMAPMEMVMRYEHLGKVPPTSPAAHEVSFTTRPGREPAALYAKPSPPAVLPAHDLARLTDAVVQSLDRRLRSYRERLGMI